MSTYTEESEETGEQKPRKSLGRRIVGILLVLILVGVAAFLACPLWLGPVVRIAANATVPSITGTPFEIGSLSVNPFAGRVRLADFRLGNPAGYDAENAASVKSFSLEVAWSEFLTDNRLHIVDLTVISPFGSYLSKDGVNNIDAILAHVNEALGLNKEEPVASETSAGPSEAGNRSDAASSEREETEPAPELKFVIDRFHVEGASVRMGLLPLPIPPFTLTGIGKDSGGLAFGELCNEVSSQVMNGANAGIETLGSLGGKSGKALKDAGAAVGDGAKAVGESAKALGESAKGLVKDIGGILGGKK